VELLALIDLKLIFVLVATPIWLPVVKIMWRAVNPYPRTLVEPGLRANAPEGPQLDSDLESEEWAVWRIRREREKAGETLPPVGTESTMPRLSRMASSDVRARAGLKRSA